MSEQTKFSLVCEVYSAVLWSLLRSMLVEFHTGVVVQCACRPPSCHCHLDAVLCPSLLGVVSLYVMLCGTMLLTSVACDGI